MGNELYYRARRHHELFWFHTMGIHTRLLAQRQVQFLSYVPLAVIHLLEAPFHLLLALLSPPFVNL